MPKRLKKPKAILFDWDNTLVDTFPIIFQGLHDTFVAMGREPWTMDEILGNKEGIHHSLRDSFPRIFGDRWEEAKAVYFKSFLSNHLAQLKMIPGAQDMLDLLAASDIYVAIVSNKTGQHLRTEVSHLGWEKYFKKTVGAQDAKNDKPFADPVYLALDGSGIAADEKVILIGDSATDVACAKNAGITPIIFGEHIFKQAAAHEIQELRTLARVNHHHELSDWIRSIL